MIYVFAPFCSRRRPGNSAAPLMHMNFTLRVARQEGSKGVRGGGGGHADNINALVSCFTPSEPTNAFAGVLHRKVVRRMRTSRIT